ncbi:Inosine/uridine-preferring nucleoside hydrolase [Gluconacetobacter diazotrophicus PA1 5]|uniref:Nucleoside hydrolase n=2 Tax=Gluconacetobacter diazotrophicus TaxID=33996 RepID=A0A7W4I4M8_GLUDI|nr:nucleoside hydrolase [Gluconacetobacter diazotrophicus]ACI50423.1 Inosine/uridine-preferring nucleoside hydrolase [Gluconacetobacter diazotrophicus PA1 5]MBB2156318.1 nucleoside hydrolase [Gluconacetobacter diazotrophicus]TWB08282.1 inosine-uridine nucleoside N-ribohydrolase [Gluconacetobacter diazotrophicus]CAP56330.1 putative pyrimidine-specific ribonucleoside hydrolase [Gluconacetobacter diazotrophicus PA1 5]
MFFCPLRRAMRLGTTRRESTPREVPRRAFRRALGAGVLGLLAAWLTAGPPARAAAPQLVIEDNDFLGPGGSDQQSIIPLLFNPAVRVLGFTVVTGDGWENQESAHLRRFLDIIGRGDVPVADGAVYPLINSVPMMRLREQQYGVIPWKGAWGGIGSIDGTPATQPPLPDLKEGAPAQRPIDDSAALFLIRQVHNHPHQVTIVAAGPLTNLALAIRIDPTFAATAKQLVFMGGLLDTSMKSLTGNVDFASDFNMIFDPEAAHITLTAPWPSITVVGNVSNDLMMTRDYLKRITQKKTKMTDYIGTYYDPLPMWDELATAIAADPGLITSSIDAYMDIDISKGPQYGHAVVWPDATAPRAMGVRKVRIVQSVDAGRFLATFLHEAQSDIHPSHAFPRP